MNLLFLALDAWLIYMGVKTENYFLLILVAFTLLLRLVSALEVLSRMI